MADRAPRLLRAAAAALLAGLGAAASPASGAARTVDVTHRASLTLTGVARGDLAGASVAAAGDVNGDGRADVIVGAPLADRAGRANVGAAYVVFGGGRGGRLRLGALGRRGFRITGAFASERTFHPGSGPLTAGAGASVAGAGDVNGDGLADLLVSGRVAAPPLIGPPHAVFVVFGKRGSGPVDLAALGTRGFAIHADDGFVTAGAGRAAGDVNGDGRADVLVDLDIDSDEDSGAVAVVFGKASSAAVDVSAGRFDMPAWGMRIVGGAAGLGLGSGGDAGAAMAAAGDVDGDGLGDVVLGAPGAARGRAEGSGTVFVVYGSRTPAQIRLRPGARLRGFEVTAPRARIGFGSSVARLGGGFVAGAAGSPLGRRSGPGEAFVVRSRRATPVRLAGPAADGPIGFSVAAPGDVNRDGRADVLTVARGHRDRATVALLFSATGARIVTYTGLRNGVEARAAAGGAGDTNGDRRPDLIFGSPGANAAYVLTR